MTAKEKSQSLIAEVVRIRQEQGLSQKKLEELSGISQPIIARIEKGVNTPQLSTVIKLLKPLGMTLAVVSIDSKK